MLTNSIWQSFPGQSELQDQVHVWHTRLHPSHARLEEFTQTLSPAERLRADRIVFEQDRRQFIARRGILRTILGRYVGIAPERLEFETGAWSKPSLRQPGANPLELSQSHSGDIAVYAFSQACPIGIDIEAVRFFPDWESVGVRFLSSLDAALLRVMPVEKKMEAFFTGWTRQEAYLKAVGWEFAQAEHAAEVVQVSSEPESYINLRQDSTQVRAWRFTAFYLPQVFSQASQQVAIIRVFNFSTMRRKR